MGRTKFLWVALLMGDTSKAYCTICQKAFRIDGSGKPQVSSHHKYYSIEDGGQHTKKKGAIDSNERVFQPTQDEKISMSEKTSTSWTYWASLSKFVELKYIKLCILFTQITLLVPHKDTQRDSSLCFQIVRLLKVMPKQMIKLSTIFNLGLPYTAKNKLYMSRDVLLLSSLMRATIDLLTNILCSALVRKSP